MFVKTVLIFPILVFFKFVLILELVSSHYSLEYEANNTDGFAHMDIRDIANLFKPPDFLKENITFRYVDAKNVGSMLQEMVNSNIIRLYISIKSPKKFNQVVDLSPLENMTDLKWFWLVAERNIITEVSLRDMVVVKFNSNNTDSLPITRLHINIPMTGNTLLYALIGRLKHLQILDLANTLTIAKHVYLPPILNNLKGKPLIAMSLRRYQSIALEPFIETMNLTKLLWTIKDCPLRYLDISANDILTIVAGFYAVTKKVEYVDISHNNLVTEGNLAALTETLLHPRLQVVIVDYQGYTTGKSKDDYRKQKLYSKDNYFIRNSNTSVVLKPRIPQKSVTDFNDLLHSDFLNLFPNIFNNCMKKLNLTINQLFANKADFCRVLNCTDRILFGGIPCEILPSALEITKHLDSKCAFGIQLPLSSSFSDLSLSNLHITMRSYRHICGNKSVCFTPNNFERLDMSRNARMCSDLYVEEIINNCMFIGVDNIKDIDFSFNLLNITIDNSGMLRSLVNLKRLFLGGNNVIISSKSRLCFDSLYHIEMLDLSSNNLQNIPGAFIKKCQQMQKFDLSFNKLNSNFLLNFNENSSFRLLNLSYNNISSLNMEMRTELKNIAKRIKYGEFVIDLKGNPLTCGCSKDSINTAKLIQNSYEHNLVFHGIDDYKCVVQYKSVLLKNADMKVIESMCFPSYFYTILFGTLVNMAFVTAVIGLCLMYKFRYRLKTSCLRCHRKCLNKPERLTGIKYDAFISYASADRFWVHRTLMTELENKYGFKLCIHYRDFPAHGDVADVIVNHIKMSRSIIVILSEYSLKTPWCDFELKNAHTQSINYNKSFIVIKMGKVPKSLVVGGLVEELLSSQVYIEWPDEDNHCNVKIMKQKQALFWEKIVKELYGQSYCKCMNCACCCFHSSNGIEVSLLDDQDSSFY